MTQFYSTNNNNNNIVLSETQLSEDFVKNRKCYFAYDSYDISKSVLANNMNKDYLSIISSLSSKEDDVISQVKYKADIDIQNKKKELKYLESNLCKKIDESDTSSAISLDSFELEFEDNEYKYSEDTVVNKEVEQFSDVFKLEDFIHCMKNMKKQLNNHHLRLNYGTMLKKFQ